MIVQIKKTALQDCLGSEHDVKTDECCGVDIAAFFCIFVLCSIKLNMVRDFILDILYGLFTLVCVLASLWISLWTCNVGLFLFSLVDFIKDMFLGLLLSPGWNFIVTAIATVPLMTLFIGGPLMMLTKINDRSFNSLGLIDVIVILLAAFILLISCETRLTDNLPAFIQNVAYFFRDTLKFKLWGPLSDTGTMCTMFDISLGLSTLWTLFFGLVIADD